MGFAWAWVWLFTAPQAYGVAESDWAPRLCLPQRVRSRSTDSAWRKYKLGEFFKIDYPETASGRGAISLLLKMSDLSFQNGDAKADRPGREGHRLRHGDPFYSACRQADGHEHET